MPKNPEGFPACWAILRVDAIYHFRATTFRLIRAKGEELLTHIIWIEERLMAMGARFKCCTKIGYSIPAWTLDG
jgi:hypothetical protein